MSLLIDHGADTAIKCLGWALLIGSCLILPFLIYLIIAFSRKRKPLHTKILCTHVKDE